MMFQSFSFKAVLLTCAVYIVTANRVPPAIASEVQHNAVSKPTAAQANDLSILDRSNLVDQKGRPFASAQLNDDLILVNFIFTHCSTSCPVQTEQLVSVMHDLPAEVRKKVAIISVSVDPANDTPSALRAYAKQQGADMTNWLFLTGKPDDISQLTKTLSVFALVASAPNVGRHTTDIRLFDRQGRFRQRYSGVPVDKERLNAEIQTMLHAAPLKPY